MKLKLNTKELEQIMSIIIKAVAVKPDQPILAGIYLKATQEKLQITSTNNELSIISQIKADVEEEGEIVILGKYFFDIVRRLPEKILEISTKKENIISITSGTANFQLLMMDKENFPKIHRLDQNDNLEKTLKFSLKDNDFKKMIKKTTFAAAINEGPSIFTGTLLDIKEEKIQTVATNSHCLSYNEYKLNDKLDLTRKTIIPAKTLDEIEHLLPIEYKNDLDIFISGNQIAFCYQDIYFAQRLLEGTFPSYENVIPTTFKTKITIKTQEFIDSLERVSFISRLGAYNIVRLEFIENKLYIHSNNPEIGTAEDKISTQKEGSDITIAFNADYLLKALKNIETQEFYFLLNEALKPGKIIEPDNETFIYVITPVRLN